MALRIRLIPVGAALVMSEEDFRRVSECLPERAGPAPGSKMRPPEHILR